MILSHYHTVYFFAHGCMKTTDIDTAADTMILCEKNDFCPLTVVWLSGFFWTDICAMRIQYHSVNSRAPGR